PTPSSLTSTPSLHDALPISSEATAEDRHGRVGPEHRRHRPPAVGSGQPPSQGVQRVRGTVDEQSGASPCAPRVAANLAGPCDLKDRKSTRLNSSHGSISYAV